jgi:NADH-quinone oxidoreductase subunit L
VPGTLLVVGVVGAATACFAATMGLTANDIKKVLAYSTISQLGYMFLALGAGAVAAGMFHLVTHAFFKACLFLGAGSVIHALGGEQDIRKMGGLARRIPVTFVTFAVATAAIAGIPPLAGFFSKDEILWYAFASGRGGSPLLFAVMATTALLTAFYMFRLLWITFFGASRMTPEVEHHVHESPLSMTGVLVVLAALSAIGGFLSVPHFLAPLLPLPDVKPELEHLETPLVVVSIALALAGLAAAAYVYGGAGDRAERLRRRFPALLSVLSGKYYVDEAYDFLIGRPLIWISDRVFLRLGDQKILDGSLHGLAALARGAAFGFARAQNGNLQRYALFVLVGIIATLAWSWRHV